MGALLEVTLPVFLVVGFGYVSVWRKFISVDSVEAIMRFTQNFAIPCLLFLAIANLDLGQHFDWPVLLSYYTGSLFTFVIGATGAHLLFKRAAPEAIAIGFAAMFSNTVLLGLPVTERAFGPDSLAPNYLIIAFHAPFCYLIGITSMEISRNKGGGFVAGIRAVARSMSRNGIMIGIALGFFVNLTALPLPAVAHDALELMARAALPAALFALGGVLYQYRPEGDMVQVCYIILGSLALHPAISWLMSHPTGLSTAQMQSTVLTAAMAPGVNSYIFASMYNVAKRVVATSVLLGTAATTITVSLWLVFIG